MQAGVPQSNPKPNAFLTFMGSKLFHTLYHSALAGAVTFLTANSFVPGKSWWIGLIGAVIGGLSVGLKEYASAAVVGLVLILCSMGSPVMAWELPGTHFGVNAEMSLHGRMTIPAPPAMGEDDFILMPTTNIGFDVSNVGNFGLGASYTFMFANVKPADQNNVSVSPYLGFGPFISANVGDWVKSNGNETLSANLGFILIGPMIQGFPELGLQVGWNTQGGPAVLSVNASFPLIIAPDSTIKKL